MAEFQISKRKRKRSNSGEHDSENPALHDSKRHKSEAYIIEAASFPATSRYKCRVGMSQGKHNQAKPEIQPVDDDMATEKDSVEVEKSDADPEHVDNDEEVGSDITEAEESDLEAEYVDMEAQESDIEDEESDMVIEESDQETFDQDATLIKQRRRLNQSGEAEVANSAGLSDARAFDTIEDMFLTFSLN